MTFCRICIHTGNNGSVIYLRQIQAWLVDSVQNSTAVMHVYNYSCTGFVVHVSEEEANVLAREPEFQSVFLDKMVQLHTTKSLSFFEYKYYFRDSISPASHPGSTANESDIIIGVIDSGSNLSALFWVYII